MVNIITELLNKTVISIKEVEDKELIFTLNNNVKIKMYHVQDCSERVWIDDISGELSNLLNTPITIAEEVFEEGEYEEGGTYTWTFYKFATIKGYVTIRWYGASNGYYSECVNIEAIS